MKPQNRFPQRPLRNGDIVEVRPASEIFATLDSSGALNGMPFMPEMVAYIGRRYRVSRRVEKICDTIAATGSRRMHDTVYLEDLRCSGCNHGGCQAGCKIYWKEDWLGPVDCLQPTTITDEDTTKLQSVVDGGTRQDGRARDGAEIWRCQATEALRASEPLKTSDLRQYWREMTNGNFNQLRLMALLVRGFFMEVASRVKLLKPTPLRGPGNQPANEGLHDLKPGDLVRVRTPAEIAVTLDDQGLNGELSFDREMLPYCGRTLRVKDKVRRIIDDKTGRMLSIPKDCIILEGAVCSGERSVGRWLCPREIHTYWRESWLEKVEKVD